MENHDFLIQATHNEPSGQYSDPISTIDKIIRFFRRYYCLHRRRSCCLATRQHWQQSWSRSRVARQDRAAAAAALCISTAAYKAFARCYLSLPLKIPTSEYRPALKMAKQISPEVQAQEKQMPSNAFLRGESTSKESGGLGKHGMNMEFNGNLGSSFRCDPNSQSEH